MKYLCVGHSCHDKVGDDFILGGTASYSSLLSKCLGSQSALLTSFGEDFLFKQKFEDENITVHNIPASKTTIFENTYVGGDRTQFLLARAATIGLQEYRALKGLFDIVHLCPIDDEVGYDLLSAIGTGVLTLATPQGWLRQWDTDGKVSYKDIDWSLLSALDFVIISDEDVPDLESKLADITSYIKNLIVTKGDQGAQVYTQGEEVIFYPAYPSAIVDPTGAGDSFATGFITRYYETNNIAESMIFAHCLASICVEHQGTSFFDKLSEVEGRVKIYKEQLI